MSRQTDLRAFAEYWLRRPLTPADGVVVPASAKVPAALREVYETFGGRAALTQAHNSLLLPDDIEVVDGYSLFYAENQYVAYWGFKIDEAGVEDPMVYQSTDSTEGLLWTPEEMGISEWIKTMTLWQLVNGGYAHCAYAGGIADGTKIVSAIYPQVGGHRDGSTRFFGADGALICLAGSESVPSVWAAAADQSTFEALIDRLGFEWDYNSLEK